MELLMKMNTNQFADCRFPKQTRRADDLIAAAGIIEEECKKPGCGLKEFEAIQRVLTPQGYALKIFSNDHWNEMIFDGGSGSENYLYIYHYDKHYDVMKSPKIITGYTFWCDLCNKGYDAIQKHKCEKRCAGCKYPGKCAPDLSIPVMTCPNCTRIFYSQKCFDNHKMPFSEVPHDASGQPQQKKRKIAAVSLCDKLKKCLQCMQSIPVERLNPRKHNCGKRWCDSCKTYAENGKSHQCFVGKFTVKKREQKKKNRNQDNSDNADEGDEGEESDRYDDGGGRTQSDQFKYLFWDFECTQERVVDQNEHGDIMEHIPRLCVCRKICNFCRDFSLNSCPSNACKYRDCAECKKNVPEGCKCGDHFIRFKGRNCTRLFCEYLFSGKHKGYTAIAHNGKGYDTQFITKWLTENRRKPSTFINRGLQILSMEVMGVRFVDSLSFVAQSLESFRKTFGLNELKKGYFPYLFYKEENMHYVGCNAATGDVLHGSEIFGEEAKVPRVV